MIVCLGPTPAAQRVMVFQKTTVGIVNRARLTFDGFAGKSINVAKVLHALGERPFALGFAGGPRGDALVRLLEERGIQHKIIRVSPPTRQCITVIDESTGTHTELVEESQPVPAEAYGTLKTLLEECVRGAKALVLSGSLTPGAPVDFYYQCTRLAREAGVFTLADASGAPLRECLRAKPDLVKPNRAELIATIGRPLTDERSEKNALRELGEIGAQNVVVTAGAGTTLAYDGRRFWRIQNPSVKALNPIGSGDSFTAGLISRLVKGDELGEACRWAAAAGAANTLSWMPGELEAAQVKGLLDKVGVESLSL